MNCPHCGSPVEPGAQFCGNCGQPLAPASQPQTAQPIVTAASGPQPAIPGLITPAPAPAMAPITPAPATPVQPVGMPGVVPSPPVYGGSAAGMPPASLAAHSHPGETRAIIGLIVAILSIPGAIIPILGLVLAITGLVLGSLSVRLKRVMAILAFVFAGIGLVLSILAWTHNVQHMEGKTPAISSTTKHYSTDCYDIAASTSLHVVHDSSTCSFTASDGATIGLSRIAYHIEATHSNGVTPDNFESQAKEIGPSLVEEGSTATRSFTLDSDTATTFQGELAHLYNLSANDGTHEKILVVLHTAPNGDNLFEFDDVAMKGNSSLALSDIESNLVWR